VDVAVFEARTSNEIGVATNRGGRSTFRNVGRTTRSGAELDARWAIARDWRAQLALTVLDARYVDAFAVCRAVPCTTPDLPVPARNRIAGTLPAMAFAELAWRATPRLEVAAEVRGQGRQPVNDANSDFAAGHGLVALRATVRHPVGAGRLEVLARVENLFDRRVAGSVIVNEANGRFFEPAPGRNALLALRWMQGF
jgi:iron complex outermembrane receptor protein